MYKTIFGIVCLLMSAVSVNAATFHYLDSPSLVGQLNGPDLLWNTADDFSTIPPGFTGFNPQGGATNFLFNGPVIFGSLVGSFETNGAVQLGVNTLTSLTANILVNDFSLATPSLGNPFIETLSSTGDPSSITLSANNSATSVMTINTSDGGTNNTFELTGNYSYLNNGDDPNILFAGNSDVIDQFIYLLPLLPTNWDRFFIGTENFEFVTGETGTQSGIFYTTSAVPVPAAVWLFGSALIGLVGLSRKK